jgi:hypothetical protein
MVMKFQPDEPMHNRYAVAHNFLEPEVGNEVVTISRVVNAFFRWEFNSCESLISGTEVYPIDYANACPDVAITSLHYYFPWAMTALVRWSTFSLVTERRPNLHVSTDEWFAIADRDDLSYGEKVAAYRTIADAYFDVERYRDFCASRLANLPEIVHEWVTGKEFDDLLVQTVQMTYPVHEQEQFLAHFRGLTGLWASDEGARLAAATTV